MPTSTVVTLMRQFKSDIARAGSAQQAEMARRWLGVERRLMGQMEALAYRMAAVREAGGTVTANMLLNDVRYRELLSQLHAEQVKYTQYAESTISDGQRAMASAGVNQSQAAIAAQVSTSFNRLPVSAVQHMVGLTGAGTPLNSLLVQSWPLSAQGLTQALVDGVALGWGPRKTASKMAEGMTGSFDRMLTIARTEQLRVYRTATMDQYKASGIVTSWVRYSARDRRVCAGCLAADGDEYDLATDFQAHPQCRCVLLPKISGVPLVFQRGSEWFAEQDSDVQESILGPGRYELYRTNQVEFSQFATLRTNAVWGDAIVPTPLRDLTGS